MRSPCISAKRPPGAGSENGFAENRIVRLGIAIFFFVFVFFSSATSINAASSLPTNPPPVPQNPHDDSDGEVDVAAGNCRTPVVGDANGDDFVDIDDTLCYMDAYAGRLHPYDGASLPCRFAIMDVPVCENGVARLPNGVIDLEDINYHLAGFTDSAIPAQCRLTCDPCAGSAPPFAEGGSNRTLLVNQAVAFNAGASIDSDGRIVGYLWKFGDGAASFVKTPSHTYTQAGTFAVKLVVLDECGNEDADVFTVTVSGSACSVNQAPVANAGPARTVDVNAAVTFSASASTDADGTITQYWWTFGDGYSTNWISASSVQHTYVTPASYVVQLWVRDNCGAQSAVSTASVVVRGSACSANRAPVASTGSYVGAETGLPVMFDGSASTDGDGFLQSYSWNFGDGTTAAGAQVAHTFSTAGVYTVALTVTDNCGATNTRTVSVDVADSKDGSLNPSLVNFVTGRVGTANGVQTSADGKRLFVASGEFGIVEFDVTRPSTPTFVKTSTVFQDIEDIGISGDYVAVGGLANYCAVSRLSEQGTAHETWRSLSYAAQDLFVLGSTAYFAAGSLGLRIVDMATPPAQEQSVAMKNARSVAVGPNGFAFVAAGAGATGGLRVVQLGASPREVASVPYAIAGPNATDIVINAAGNYVYMSEYGDGIAVFDVTSPASPRRIRNVGTPTQGPFGSLSISGDLLVASSGLGTPTVRIYSLAIPAAPVQLAVLPGAIDVKIHGNTLYAASGSQVTIYDLTNVRTAIGIQPPILNSIMGGVSNRTAIATNGKYVLVAGSSTLTSVVDVDDLNDSSDSTDPVWIGDIPSAAGDIDLLGNHVYLSTGFAGLRVANISNPRSPTLGANLLDTDGTVFPSNGLAVHRTSDGRNWALVAANARGLKVLDLANPAAPVVRATLDTPGNAMDVAVSGDGRYAYVADFGSGLQVVDITSILAPRIVGTFQQPSNQGPAMKVAAKGFIAYVTWGYQVKIVDATNPTSLRSLFVLPTTARVDFHGDYVLVPADVHGLLIYDASNPLLPPVEKFRVRTPGLAQSVVVFGDTVYVGDSASIVDVVNLIP